MNTRLFVRAGRASPKGGPTDRETGEPVKAHVRHHTQPTLHKIIMDTRQDGVIFLDARGVAVECNRSAARIIGLRKEDIVGRTSIDPALFSAVHKDGTPVREEEHPRQIVLKSGKPCMDRIQGVLRSEGEVLWIHITAIPVPKTSGGIRGVVVSIHDITPLKRLGNRLRKEAIRDELKGLSASFGVAAQRHEFATPGMLLEAADQALYQAKQEGRNRVVIAE